MRKRGNPTLQQTNISCAMVVSGFVFVFSVSLLGVFYGAFVCSDMAPSAAS
jgi:hypothetical protein